jgi:hypothetical protein
MDNTIGKHVAFSQLMDGGSELSRFVDRTLPYDRDLGPLRQSDPVDATSICFRWWPADFNGVFNFAAGKHIVLVSEGAVSIKSGDGENRTFRPGAVLELSQHDRQDYLVQAADGQPFRAAVIDLDGVNGVQAEAVLPHQSEQSLPYVRNVTGIDQRSHFEDGLLRYFVESDGSLFSRNFALTKFQYVYAAADLRYDFHNAPQRQIVIPLTGGTQGENGDGSRRVIPPGGVYFGEDTTGEGHITSAVNNEIRFSIFAFLA